MKDKNSHIIHLFLNREIDIEEVKNRLSKEEFQTWKITLQAVEDMPNSDFDTEVEFEKLQQKKNSTNNKTQVPFLKIASVLLLFLCTSMFIIWYNVTDQELTSIASNTAKEEFIALPDESLVRLNESSKISFSQENWEEERSVTLDGEAYFNVQEGKTFTVKTPNGTVQVLGTTFNVNSRKNKFSVTCYTGKVQVKFNDREFILGPKQTIDNASQQINLVKTNQPDWKSSRSSFESAPLSEVIEDIEKHKNVKIQLILSDSINFTGSYNHNMESEEIIDLVCRSLDLSYKKLNSTTFEVSSEEDY